MENYLDSHKKILGILYLISGTLVTLAMFVLNAFLAVIFSFAFNDADPEDQKIMELIVSFVQYVPVVVIVFSAIPTFVAGIGLLMRKGWATLVALIVGCLKLFSFPIGTAIGIYAIWIYAEEQKLNTRRQAS